MRPSKRRAGYDVAAPARAIGHVLHFTVFTRGIYGTAQSSNGLSAKSCAPLRLLYVPSRDFKQERGNLTSSGFFHPVPACWMAPVVPGLLAPVGVLVGSTADPWIMPSRWTVGLGESVVYGMVCMSRATLPWDNAHHVDIRLQIYMSRLLSSVPVAGGIVMSVIVVATSFPDLTSC